MSEQYVNLGSSTTVGSIDNTTNPVTFSVQTGAGALFPVTTNGSFRVTVSNSDGTNAEVMLCTSITGDTLTCSRGSSATLEAPVPTLLSHGAGSLVSNNISSGAMNQIRQDLNGYGTFSGLPTTGAARKGDTYTATDSIYDRFIFNGTVWLPHIQGMPCTTITSATFTTSLVSANITVDTFANSSDGSLVFAVHRTAGTDNVAAKLFAYPSAPFTKRLRVFLNDPWTTFDSMGFCISDGTKLITWGPSVTTGNDIGWRGVNWTNTTTASAQSFFNGFAFPGRGGVFDFEFNDDNTNRILNIYADGINKTTIFSEGHNTFLTPTLFGIGIVPYVTEKRIMTVAHLA